MWFKNVRAYRLTKPFDLSPEMLGQKLVGRSFVPCAKSQAQSLGWVPPLGEESEELVHAAAGRILLKLKREEKLLPSTVVREQLDEKVAAIESEPVHRRPRTRSGHKDKQEHQRRTRALAELSRSFS